MNTNANDSDLIAAFIASKGITRVGISATGLTRRIDVRAPRPPSARERELAEERASEREMERAREERWLSVNA